MFKKFLWLATLVSSLMMSQMVLADSSMCRESLSQMVQSVNPDAAQKAKIDPILEQLKSTLKANGSQMEALEPQITEQVNAPNIDQEKFNKLVEHQTNLIGDVMKAKIMAKNQIFSILNPEQKGKLQDMIKKSNEKMVAMFKKCHQD
jgi:protein CpxP